MTILAVGDEPESFSNFHTGTLVVQTSYKDTEQRGGLYANATNIWHMDLASAVSELWVRFISTRFPTISTSNPLMMFSNIGTGKDALRVFYSSANTVRVQYNSSGTTYTTLVEFEYPTSDSTAFTHEVVMYFKRGASGILRVWIDDNLIVDLSGNYSTVDTTWDRVRLAGASASTSTTSATAFAGIILADEPLHGYAVDHLTPDGNGTYSAWTGSYTDIADVTGAPQIDTTTDINTNAAAQKFTASFENMASVDTDSREIGVVQIAARGILEGGSTPTDVLFMARHSGADYTLNSLGLSASASSYQQVMPLDPAGSAWTEANVNALELGVTT